MITSNPLIGTGLHAIGGISASSCYLPYQKTSKWSWNSFWLIQSFFAWILIPAIIGYITVPQFFTILLNAPSGVFWGAFLLGAAYGFGGMSFGYAIGNIGYSLTYTIAIGISAVLGTVFPLIYKSQLIEHFSKPGGSIVLVGMIISMVGVGLCGWAGFKKEKDIANLGMGNTSFHMTKGLFLAIFAGILSAVFNISLEVGQPIADMAAQSGAGSFQGNAKLIVSTAGCYAVNFVWFVIASIKQGTLKDFSNSSESSVPIRLKNIIWSAFAGSLWCFQFFFYGLGHVKMGNFQFASWVLHMSMLIFFSYVVGVVMKEWKNVKRNTYTTLIVALLVLVLSFVITTYGSVKGEERIQAASNR